MSAFIRLGPGTSGGPLGIPSEGAEYVRLTSNMQGVLMKAPDALCVGGKNDGTLTSIIEANQTVIIRPPVLLQPRRFETIVSVNPELILNGTVSHPIVIQPGQGQDILIKFKATKKINLNDLDYIFSLHMVS
jgi:hypothetical protein